MTRDQAEPQSPREDLDVLIVGAGFAGMYMLHQCRALGLSARVVESGPSVGGTWYWNRYPGLRCDVESMQYSYSFDAGLQQEWRWTERYASQPEILRYAEFVADRLDLRRDIAFDTRVTSIHYDEAKTLWDVATAKHARFKARFVVMATGCLSVPKNVNIPGVDRFKGEVYHTARWPLEPVDFAGKRVGVIGTGSSGIQIVPLIAQQAKRLHVFQRTPSYTFPAKNHPLDDGYVEEVKSHYEALRNDARRHKVGIPAPTYAASTFDVDDRRREEIFGACYDQGLPFALMVAFDDLLVSEDANRTAQRYLDRRIRERIKSPELADQLIPHNQFVGTRRVCLDTGYYETFERANVSLVNLARNPIETITPSGVQLQKGLVNLDCLVFATGYDAMTGALLAIDIQGENRVKLRDCWAAGPRTMMGLMMAGFPNLFTITGPGSPSVVSNVLLSIEQHVEWIAACLGHMQAAGKHKIRVQSAAQERWVEHVNAVARATLFPRGNTWYLGANVPGKPRVFMPYLGGVGTYRQECQEVAADGYKGFVLS